MADAYITIDNGAIINLFASGKQGAWDQLVAKGRKLIVPQAVLDELAEFDSSEASGSALKGIRQKFGTWVVGRTGVTVIRDYGEGLR